MSGVNGSELSSVQAGFRFLLEMVALVCWGIVGWQLVDGAVGRWFLAMMFPVAAATVWGTFRVPDDRSASGQAPITVEGPVRLFLELAVLLGAAVMTAVVWRQVVGVALGAAVIAHYVMTLPRVRWLLGQRSRGD